MLDAGSEPVAWDSVLTGLSATIYNQKISSGIYQSSSQIEVTVNTVTYTETLTNRNNRVLNNKKSAFAEAKAIVDYLPLNTVVGSGIAVQVNTGTGTGATTSTGTIS